MNREIKFRAWDVWNNEMITDGTVCMDFCKDFYKQEEHGFIYLQSTGIKDKNGKEIYEGDIIDFQDCLLLIEWQEGRSFVGFSYKILKQKDENIIHDIRLYRLEERGEVIGNRFEHEHLL